MNQYSSSLLLLLSIILFSCSKSIESESKSKPNVVIIFLDDAGYSDFSPFGQVGIETPNVQQLADEGVRFTNFHVPQAICSASRAALMTGLYPGRTKVFGAHGPKEKGLDTIFPTMGELFQKAGYKTGVFGKWHLGDLPETRPHNRGFDESAGLMYSNDMWKHHPVNPTYWGRFPIQYWKNGQVTIEDVGVKEQKQLTKWYTEGAVDFINRNSQEPFLLYLPHSMPHVPIFCSEAFEGKSGKGLYADVTMELDWSVGEIMKALKNNNVDDNTIVIFSSDNGPWAAYGNHAGTTPFKEAKATSFEGGTRSACIIKYPEHLKAGTESSNMFTTLDLLPTLANIATVQLPKEPLDGKDVWNLISNKDQAYPQDYYAFTTGNKFESVMSGNGKWKLHLPHDYRTLTVPGIDGNSGKYETKTIELSLFDMENDPYETTNVIGQHPEIKEQLLGYANAHKARFFN